MEKKYNLCQRIDLVVPTAGLETEPRCDHVFVFEFRTKPDRAPKTIIAPAAFDLPAH
jgi:hypothetical protein